jgi:biofilm PGA synthesis N-glycosyltransferase PgaC
MCRLLFWISLFIIFYAYAGYPLFLWISSRLRHIEVRKGHLEQSVSVILAVFNEETRIGKRLENLLQQDYPKEKLEIIVVSDGSSDGTCAIVRSFAGSGVRFLDLGVRRGKALALNAGVAAAEGEIIVFADARQRFEQNAISRLVANFSDPGVGCVSGELLFMRDDTSLIKAEMGAYWSYEKWVRKMESATGSVVGATGAIYAIRRALYRPLPSDTILDDVLTPLTIVAQSYRCIFDGSAKAYDILSKDAAQEWRRKVRTLAGNWQLLSLRPELLLPWRNPLWGRFISHKIMRIVVPFALLTAMGSGLFFEDGFYRAVSLAFALLCLSAAISAFSPSVRTVKLTSVNFFFMTMNVAALAGFWFWITGRCDNLWQHSADRGDQRT